MLSSTAPRRTGASSALRRTSSLFAALFILLLPVIAWAEPLATATATAIAPAPTALDRLSAGLLDIIVPVVVTAVGVFASWCLLKLKQKLHLDISDASLDQWSNLAKSAAARGAEWARNEAKKLTAGQKVPGPAVLEQATNWAMDVAASLNLPEKARKTVEGWVEAELNKLRREQAIENTAIAKGAEGGLTISAGSLPPTV